MNLYENLLPYEKLHMNQSSFDEKIAQNRIIALNGKRGAVLIGEGLRLKVNSSVGLNTPDSFEAEAEKIRAISRHSVGPDIMMDLSTVKTADPLYKIINHEIGCPIGIIPYYTCFYPKNGLDKNELLETIEEQAASGISFMTLHLTADISLAEQALSRKIPVISRGGSLLLRDMKKNRRTENILLCCLREIVRICKKYQVAVSIGTTFRPSTLHDALDAVHLSELQKQKEFCKALKQEGIPILMEGIGHISLSRIPEYVSRLREGGYIPFMPLGPIVSDRTQGQDHITAAIGASCAAAFDGADIINAVTREEHTGGVPSTSSILEAIETANTIVEIINDTRFPEYFQSMEKTFHNCMGDPRKTGCSRCGAECPFLWNDEM